MNSSGTFISQTGTWIKATFNGKTGYLSQGYAKIVDSGTTPTTPSNPNGKVVVLDPGHGGADPGAPGIDRVTYEHQINYAVAVKTKAELEKRGYKVIMTRGNNQSCVPHYELHSDLQCRVDVATNNHANIFVSIHANWSQYPNAYGIEGYYNAKSTSDYPQMNPYPAQSQKLANLVEAQVVSAMNGYNRGVQNASLYVNRMAKVPSTLVELGFLSNPSDLAKMKDPSRQQRIASGIATAIDSYFSN
jgi:N-acetylmuramoyl-L-alanine amidase